MSERLLKAIKHLSHLKSINASHPCVCATYIAIIAR